MQPKLGEGFDLPEGNDGWSDWTWFHARAEYPQRFTVLCETPVNYSGHYRKGRMHACPGDGCPLCAAGVGSQARYVFSVVDWESRRVGLLELGRGHALWIQDASKSHGGLRGLSFEVERAARAKQSRLDLRLVTDAVPAFFQHLSGPDLKRAVEATWRRQASQMLAESGSGEVAPAQGSSSDAAERRRTA
jgi:hypothetical protein